MDATTEPYNHTRNSMKMNNLRLSDQGAGSRRGRDPKILMNIGVPECHSFSHAQTNLTKGHRRIPDSRSSHFPKGSFGALAFPRSSTGYAHC